MSPSVEQESSCVCLVVLRPLSSGQLRSSATGSITQFLESGRWYVSLLIIEAPGATSGSRSSSTFRMAQMMDVVLIALSYYNGLVPPSDSNVIIRGSTRHKVPTYVAMQS